VVLSLLQNNFALAQLSEGDKGMTAEELWQARRGNVGIKSILATKN
jgi:hypothetical protein